MDTSNIIRYIAKQQGIDFVDFDNDVKLRGTRDGIVIDKWSLPIVQPTAQDLINAEPLAQAEADLVAYIDLRKAEYPPIEDQLDCLYWDLVNRTTTFVDALTAVKIKYPKPPKP